MHCRRLYDGLFQADFQVSGLKCGKKSTDFVTSLASVLELGFNLRFKHNLIRFEDCQIEKYKWLDVQKN